MKALLFINEVLSPDNWTWNCGAYKSIHSTYYLMDIPSSFPRVRGCEHALSLGFAPGAVGLVLD